jgi:hypothetical protein
LAGKHAAENPDRPGKRLQVSKEVKKELGKAVETAKTKKGKHHGKD